MKALKHRNSIRTFLTATLFCLPLSFVPTSSAHAERQMEDMSTVVLKTIDKLSARTHTFDIPVDKTVKFGSSLFIKARACRKASALDKPENAAFLQIWERKPDEEKAEWVFSGWMFASNPSVSAMNHPVYDVWIVDCKSDAVAAKAEEFSSETAPAAAPEKDDAIAAETPDSDQPGPEAPKPVAAKPVVPAAVTPPADMTQGKSVATPSVPPLDQLPSSFEDDSEEDETAPDTGD